MSSNVKVRSNVVPQGDPRFEKCVRGAEAVTKLLQRKHPKLRDKSNRWLLLREAAFLQPGQVLDIAWQTPCVGCGAKPEGLVAGEVTFRCPLNKCPARRPVTREVNITPELLARVESTTGDLDSSVQLALERFGNMPMRTAPLPSRDQRRLFVRLKPLQYLLYEGWEQQELSDHVERALFRFFGLAPDDADPCTIELG